jgi:hypothetical protein
MRAFVISMQHVDLDIERISGTDNPVADAVSRFNNFYRSEPINICVIDDSSRPTSTAHTIARLTDPSGLARSAARRAITTGGSIDATTGKSRRRRRRDGDGRDSTLSLFTTQVKDALSVLFQTQILFLLAIIFTD